MKNSPYEIPYLQASSGEKQRLSALSGKKTSHKMSSEDDDMPFNMSSGGLRKSAVKKMGATENVTNPSFDHAPEIEALKLQLDQQKRATMRLENECKRLREDYSKKNIGVFLEDSSKLVSEQQSRSDAFIKALVEKNKKIQTKNQEIST